jgi:hypothetical protein
MRSATPSGGPIQTGTLIGYSLRGDARLGSPLRAASVQTDPNYLNIRVDKEAPLSVFGRVAGGFLVFQVLTMTPERRHLAADA